MRLGAAWVKDYGQLLVDDPAYADKAKRIAALAKDPGELLAGWVPTLKRKLGRLPPEALGSFTFHPPCSLSHAQDLSRAGQPGPIELGMRVGFDVRFWPCATAISAAGPGGIFGDTARDVAAVARSEGGGAGDRAAHHCVSQHWLHCAFAKRDRHSCQSIGLRCWTRR